MTKIDRIAESLGMTAADMIDSLRHVFLRAVDMADFIGVSPQTMGYQLRKRSVTRPAPAKTRRKTHKFEYQGQTDTMSGHARRLGADPKDAHSARTLYRLTKEQAIEFAVSLKDRAKVVLTPPNFTCDTCRRQCRLSAESVMVGKCDWCYLEWRAFA